MDSMSSMTPMSGGGMMPYLHFSGGDNLYLNIWAPSSKGEIAAACIGLFIIAILERLVAAMKTVFDLHWHQRALAVDAVAAAKIASATKSEPQGGSSVVNTEPQKADASPAIPPRFPRLRTIPPFIAEQDIPRGILFAFQMLIVYLLMLAIMTFQAAYLFSIVLGLGVGETLFGRVSRAGH